MTIPSNIISAIKAAKKVAVLPHISADGDALGSSFAFAMALARLNKEAAVFLEEEIPYIYSFLPGKQFVKVYEGNAEIFDTVVALDTGDLGRLGSRTEILNSAKITINIDHHQTNSEFAFHNFVQTSSSAVGEIIYELIKSLGLDIDSETALCLYVAIATDTGGFRFSNTTPLTHQITADLISKGINVSDVSQKVFDTTSLEKVKLMGEAVNSIELLERGRVAVITITDESMKRAGAKEEDCDGIISLGRNIRGVEVAVMFRQRENGEIKVNLRSNTYVDVAAIANMFKGGGHKRAAGCTIQGKIEDARNKLLADIKEAL